MVLKTEVLTERPWAAEEQLGTGGTRALQLVNRLDCI